MSNNNILEPIPANFNEYLRKYDTVTLSDTTPAALPSTTNVTFQQDGFGNVSACVAASGGGNPSVGTAGQLQMVGSDEGTFAASDFTNAGGLMTLAPTTQLRAGQNSNLALTATGSDGYNALVFNQVGSTPPNIGILVGLFHNPSDNNLYFNVQDSGAYQFRFEGASIANLTPTLFTAPDLKLSAATTATSATAGAATALPAAPLGYLQITVNGTAVKLPYYTV